MDEDTVGPQDVVVRDCQVSCSKTVTSGSSDTDSDIFRLIVENATDMLVLADASLRRQYVSPACFDVMGYTEAELVGRTPVNLVHPDDLDHVMTMYQGLDAEHPTASTVWRMLRADGSFRWMETTYRRLPDGGVVSVVRDIQRRKETEERLEEALLRVERLAMHDSLTDLPNRRCFLDAIDRGLACGTVGAIMIIDLDRFKQINDLHGHAAGDEVLVEVAARLRRIGGSSAMFARLGGDEFAALLDVQGRDEVLRLAHAIVEALSLPLDVGPIAYSVGASVGIAFVPQDGADSSALLRNADAAMYHAKRTSGPGRRVFHHGMDDPL